MPPTGSGSHHLWDRHLQPTGNMNAYPIYTAWGRQLTKEFGFVVESFSHILNFLSRSLPVLYHAILNMYWPDSVVSICFILARLANWQALFILISVCIHSFSTDFTCIKKQSPAGYFSSQVFKSIFKLGTLSARWLSKPGALHPKSDVVSVHSHKYHPMCCFYYYFPTLPVSLLKGTLRKGVSPHIILCAQVHFTLSTITFLLFTIRRTKQAGIRDSLFLPPGRVCSNPTIPAPFHRRFHYFL